MLHLIYQGVIIKRNIINSERRLNNFGKGNMRKNNQQIKIIRSSVKHRHDGRFITNYESLYKVEKVIYQYLKNKK